MNFKIAFFISFLLSFTQVSIANSNYSKDGTDNLLFTGNNYTIYSNNTSGLGSFCKYTYFRLIIEYDVGPDHVLSPEFIYETVFQSTIPQLIQRHCQKPTQVRADIFYKNIFINYDGERISRDQMEKGEGIRPDRFAHASVYFQEPGFTGKIEPSKLRVSYYTSERFRLDDETHLREAGSMTRLQAYIKRGRRTPAEAKKEDDKNRAFEQYVQNSAHKYGVQFENIALAYMLDSNLDKKVWNDSRKWDILRTYLWTTTEVCGNKTVGKPQKTFLRYDTPDNSGDTQLFIWHSAELRPTFDSYPWNTAFSGLRKSDASYEKDFRALIKVHGCGSKPFQTIESFFLK